MSKFSVTAGFAFLCFLSLILYSCGGALSERPKEATSAVQQKSKHKQNSREEGKRLQQPTKAKEVPQKVYDVLIYVQEHNRAPMGYVGGKRFGNFEKLLPRKGPGGEPAHYREWDVNPKRKGKNRGPERLITDDNKKAWYTTDHYRSFIEIK